MQQCGFTGELNALGDTKRRRSRWIGGFMGQVGRVEVSADTEDKVRRRTTRSRMSVETNDGFLIGLYTGAWGIV